MSRILHLNCPQCGGTLGMEGMERVVCCRYCRTWSLVEASDLEPEYWVKPRLNQVEARRALQKLLLDKDMPRGLLQLARFHSARLHFVPFHEVNARRTGTMIVTLRETSPRRSQLEDDEPGSAFIRRRHLEEAAWGLRSSEPEKDTRVVMNDVTRLEPAVELNEWSLEEAELSRLRTEVDGALSPINRREMERLGTIQHPTITPDQIVARLELRAGTADLDDRTEFGEIRAKCIYYPVWRVRYQYQGRLFGATLDGVTGKTMAARAPQDDKARVLWLLGMSALASLLPGKILGSIFAAALAEDHAVGGMLEVMWRLPPFIVPAVVIGLMALTVILGIGWDEFRYPGELVIRGAAREVVKINRPEHTLLDTVRDGLLGALGQSFKVFKNRSRGDWP